MALNINTIDPQFIWISYDIRGKTGRRKFRETIRKLGAVRRNDSDYYCLFSTQLYEEMNKVIEKEGTANFNVEIIPSATTDDLANLYRDKYELAFIKQFEDAEKDLDFIRLALAQDKEALKENKETGEKEPYTGQNLMHMMSAIEHDIRVIEKALGKRREVEYENWKMDKTKIQHFEALEKKLEAMNLRADKYGGAIRAMAKREDKGFGAAVPIDVSKL